jgi:hypothetical protein
MSSTGRIICAPTDRRSPKALSLPHARQYAPSTSLAFEGFACSTASVSTHCLTSMLPVPSSRRYVVFVCWVDMLRIWPTTVSCPR